MRVLWATALVLLVDQVTKVIVKLSMYPGESIPVVGRLFRFTFTENPGMAFGIELGGGDAGKLFLSVFSVLATVAIGVWLHRVRSAPFGYRLALALVLGGALGNVVDRVFYGLAWGYAPLGYGNVVDFLHLDVWRGSIPDAVPFFGGSYVALFPIGNVADVSILVGITLLMLSQKAFQEHIQARQSGTTPATVGPPAPNPTDRTV
ncbi:MAG TPA: signal peptidase II [Rubricoccaceae bacterium]|jgi:signal peptidase II